MQPNKLITTWIDERWITIFDSYINPIFPQILNLDSKAWKKDVTDIPDCHPDALFRVLRHLHMGVLDEKS